MIKKFIYLIQYFFIFFLLFLNSAYSADVTITGTQTTREDLQADSTLTIQSGGSLVNTDLNIFAEFTLKFSSESPLLYGAFAIILAITLGALAAWMRKIISPTIKKLLSDFRNKNQTKKDEVKFPEK